MGEFGTNRFACLCHAGRNADDGIGVRSRALNNLEAFYGVEPHFAAIDLGGAAAEKSGVEALQVVGGGFRRREHRAVELLETRIRFHGHAPDARIALVHARIVEDGNDSTRSGELGVRFAQPFSLRFEVGDLSHRDFERPGKPLSGAAGDAQPREAPRPFAEGDEAEFRLLDAGLREEIAHHRQQPLAVAAADVLHMRQNGSVGAQKGGAALFLSRVERKNMRNRRCGHGSCLLINKQAGRRRAGRKISSCPPLYVRGPIAPALGRSAVLLLRKGKRRDNCFFRRKALSLPTPEFLMTDDSSASTPAAAAPLRTRTRLSPNDRRQSILAAARRCCVKKGAFDLSLADVAEEAGISRNLVYHYFKNQELLLEALLVAEGEVLAARAAAVEPLPGEAPRETLRRLICAFLDFTAERADGFSLLHSAPNMKPLLRERFNESANLFSGRILKLLALPDTPASRAAVEAATGFLLRFAYIERDVLAKKRDAAADLCLSVIESAAEGIRRFEQD